MGRYNERCLERGTKSWEELKTRLAAIQAETNPAEATTLQPSMMLCCMEVKHSMECADVSG